MSNSHSPTIELSTPAKLHGSLAWDADLMLKVRALAAEQGHSFNKYMAKIAAEKVAAIESRRRRDIEPLPATAA